MPVTETDVQHRLTVTPLSFEELEACRENRLASDLRWDCLFALPAWVRLWWEHFGGETQVLVCGVRCGDRVVGIAPLQVQGGVARFLGSVDVCDYCDMVTAPGYEQPVFAALGGFLRRRGITRLELGPLHPDAVVCRAMPVSVGRLRPTGAISCELRLPGTWDQYLELLSGRQRHEVRRKLRRLEEAGRVRFRTVTGGGDFAGALRVFVALFRSNRADKAAFLDARTEAFFTALATALAREGIARLCLLELNGAPVAALLCFDHGKRRSLYNNGYDAAAAHLSVGMLSKLYSIRDSIEQGYETYDFLKGAEAYKQRLGGLPVELLSAHVALVQRQTRAPRERENHSQVRRAHRKGVKERG